MSTEFEQMGSACSTTKAAGSGISTSIMMIKLQVQGALEGLGEPCRRSPFTLASRGRALSRLSLQRRFRLWGGRKNH